MENLTKQQIVLLTLLVSFVTSIATGIVTVSLMDQTPVGIPQTINRVITRTIEQASSGDATDTNSDTTATAANAVTLDPAAVATALVEKSIVQIKSGDTVTGLGVIVSKNGLIIADKSAIADLSSYVAVLQNGRQFPVDVVQSQNDGDIVFLLARLSDADKVSGLFTAATLAPAVPVLGQSVLTLSETDTTSIANGIVKQVEEGSTTDNIATSINPIDTAVGSPLFDMNGAILGIATHSLVSADGAVFYPTSVLVPIIPVK